MKHTAAHGAHSKHQPSKREMGDLQPPKEVSNGTATYIMLTIFALIVIWASRFLGKFSKDEAQIGSVVAVTTGLFAWLLWLCAWMHQWHPLITPEWTSED